MQKDSQSVDVVNRLAKVGITAIDDCLERLRNYILWVSVNYRVRLGAAPHNDHYRQEDYVAT